MRATIPSTCSSFTSSPCSELPAYDQLFASKYIQPWTFYAFKLVFATYLTLSIIVLMYVRKLLSIHKYIIR